VRAGTDVTLAAAGHAVTIALEAAHVLEREGIEAEVVDLMCLVPLDGDAIDASVRRTGRLVTIEEGSGKLGIGAEIVASIAAESFQALKSAPQRIAGAHVPMPYAAELQALALPTAAQVVSAVSGMVPGRKNSSVNGEA
jgi:pyruvate dehydrogenase E1 component beta subunit